MPRSAVHHGVHITDSALVSAATLSDRYLTERFLPDKASMWMNKWLASIAESRVLNDHHSVKFVR